MESAFAMVGRALPSLEPALRSVLPPGEPWARGAHWGLLWCDVREQPRHRAHVAVQTVARHGAQRERAPLFSSPPALAHRLPRERERSIEPFHAHLRPQLGGVVEHADGENVVVVIPRGRERARHRARRARERRDDRERAERAHRGEPGNRTRPGRTTARGRRVRLDERRALVRRHRAAREASLPHADASTRPDRERRRCPREWSARPMIDWMKNTENANTPLTTV